MKVLLIRFSSIGDIVLTSPIVRCIKEQVPQVELHFLTRKNFAFTVDSNPNIDKIISFDKSIYEVIPQLVMEQYDYIVDLHKNFRSLQVKQALDVPVLTFNKLNFRKWWYVQTKQKKVMPPVSIVDRYFNGINKLGVVNDGKGLDYYIPEENKIDIRKDLPATHWSGYWALVIGGSYVTKQMPVHKWVDYCKQLNKPVVLLGGKEDQEMGEQIAEAVDGGSVYNACGKFSFHESADIVRLSHAVVTNDTGLMHVAAAFQKKIVAIWGNTTPELGMFPYYGDLRSQQGHTQQWFAAEVKNLSCRPCSKIGYRKCPKGHFKCMELQNVEDLVKYSLQ